MISTIAERMKNHPFMHALFGKGDPYRTADGNMSNRYFDVFRDAEPYVVRRPVHFIDLGASAQGETGSLSLETFIADETVTNQNLKYRTRFGDLNLSVVHDRNVAEPIVSICTQDGRLVELDANARRAFVAMLSLADEV